MTRDEAKAAGLKRYNTGKPCLRGHLSERLVSTHSCCQCILESQQTDESRAKNADYRKANADKIAAYRKANADKRAEYLKANAEKIAARAAAYYKTNRSERLAQNAAYNQANRAEIAAKRAAYAKANPEKIAAQKAAYRKANRPLMNAIAAKRRAQKLQATPSWVDFEAIKAVYEQAAFITRVTGEQNHVDHIYPLQGKKVCGLHVAANLQILTASANRKKSNKLLPMYQTPESAVQ